MYAEHAVSNDKNKVSNRNDSYFTAEIICSIVFSIDYQGKKDKKATEKLENMEKNIKKQQRKVEKLQESIEQQIYRHTEL